MNDETKAAVERFRTWEFDGLDARDHAAILAHLDGEPARLAAALENLREACARRVDAVKCYGYGVEADEPGTRDQCAGEVRATPLDATPLADELRTLRARVAELEAMLVHAGTGQRGAKAVETLDRLTRAEAQVAEAHERLDEFGMRRDGESATLVEGIAAMRERIDEYRAEWYRAEAQVAAARAECEWVLAGRRDLDAYVMATDVLRAMDEASTTK